MIFHLYKNLGRTFFVLSRSTRLTDGQTGGQTDVRTDGRTAFSWLDRDACDACRTEKDQILAAQRSGADMSVCHASNHTIERRLEFLEVKFRNLRRTSAIKKSQPLETTKISPIIHHLENAT